MVNIKTKFPRGISDQAISEATGTPTQQSVRPGPGLKRQASSSKHQATSKPEPSSGSETSSSKLQASSYKRQA